jgi:O-antigen/teichoic acid export membrane protein
MIPAKRIFVNTVAQYVKAIINTGLSLFTVRLVLKILGQADYGIMSIIGGLIVLLGFITNAMVVTTQRYLSFDYGRGDSHKIRVTFSNCMILHIVLGGTTLLLMLILEPWIVSASFLNIEAGRWAAAHGIYKIASVMLFTTFLTAPFKALLVARENIIFISVVEVIDGFFKLVAVLFLSTIQADKLIAYGFILLAIMLFELLMFSSYSLFQYPECSLRYLLQDVSRDEVKRLSGFAGWTTYGMGVIISRNQGIAWLINQFFGTVVNASYGIANQLFSAVQFISTSVINAMNPQIMKAEGHGEHMHMLDMATKESKVIVCMMSILFIPLMVEMDAVLSAWLEDTPPYTALFCRALLSCFIIDQFTAGLNSANQAIGHIRTYTLIMYTPKLLLLLVAFALLHLGYGVYSIMFCFIVTEAFVALLRLPYMHHVAGLSIRHYVGQVAAGNILLIGLLLLVAVSLSHITSWPYRFLVTIPFTALVGCVLAWWIVLSGTERTRIRGMIFKSR